MTAARAAGSAPRAHDVRMTRALQQRAHCPTGRLTPRASPPAARSAQALAAYSQARAPAIAHLAMAAGACGDACGLAGADWELLEDDEAGLLVPYPPLLLFDQH